MKKEMILGIIIIGLILTSMPISTATIKSNIKPTIYDKYSECYVDISGLLSVNDWPRLVGIDMWKMLFLRPDGNENSAAFVFYWYILFDKTAEITIYTQENGEILWQNEGDGEPEIRIIWFVGDYISYRTEEGRIHKDIKGNAKIVWVNEY